MHGGMKRWSVLVVAVALMAAAACAPTSVVRFPDGGPSPVTVATPDVVGPLRLVGRQLVDAAGRVVLIHGTNSVRKTPPYISTLSDGWLAPADLARFVANGWNGVRLGVWPASLMPEVGVIDTAYLDRVQAAVDALSAAGMWVLLDFHQDVFVGMPDWATTPGAAALSPEPPSFLTGIGWASGYASPRSLRQWEDWWSDAPLPGGRSMIDAYGDGVAALASRFAGATNVIGIDLLNEPFAGERFFDCLTTCVGRYQQVASAFDRWTARARAVAPDLPIWWEPFTFGTPFPGAAPADPNVGYSFHAYCIGTDGGQPVAPDPTAAGFCEVLFGGNFGEADAVRNRWNRPALLGEFGASSSPLNATLAARLADEHLMSWLHWHDPPLWPEVVQTQLVRTYAQATAGQPLSQRYDPATGDFEFRYRPDPTVSAPTSIVVPARPYPDGYVATVTGGAVTSAANAGRLTVAADAGASEVEVRVRRAERSP